MHHQLRLHSSKWMEELGARFHNFKKMQINQVYNFFIALSASLASLSFCIRAQSGMTAIADVQSSHSFVRLVHMMLLPDTSKSKILNWAMWLRGKPLKELAPLYQNIHL